MKLLRIAVTLGLLANPAFAQMLDLPRLTWPTDSAPVTQGCDDPTSLGTSVQCGG
jgi:hypothetical protein